MIDDRQTPALPAAPACPVADTMRRVHAELRAGRAPSFEAMLAYGVPAPGAAA
ncbi:MAG: hypothetical protein KY461_11730 [Actinobacteria bacterium]|nr:hypothetical protein [Actinomycetota bacterium]